MVHRNAHGPKKEKLPRRLPRSILLPFAFVFLVAAASQARVQIFGSKEILDRGERSGRYLVSRDETARRGSIWTSDGRLLAHDVEASELGVHFGMVPKTQGFFLDLSEASGIPAAEFERLASTAVGWRFWRDTLSPSRAAAILAVKTRWKADGVSLRRVGERRYPMREAAAGIVGYLQESEPKAGIELSQNDVLRGRDGRTVGLVDRMGAFLPMRLDGRTVARKDGDDVVLTIDSQLQLAAGTAIRNVVESNGASGGAIVVLDPKTGDIWAMAHWPSLDPMRLGEPVLGGDRPSSLNLAYQGLYEPGSTFKILTLAEALELGVTTPNEVIHCSGSLRVHGRSHIRCAAHGGVRAHGPVDPEQAIARSCNVAASTWALRIGHERMVAFLDKTGLLTRTALGLPFEQRGRFDRDAYAKPLQIANVGFGQALTATPVALTAAFASIANHGVRMQPRLIRRVGDREVPIEPGERLFRPEVADTVLEFMESVVESDIGTGNRLRIPGYRLAGKTGTAQKTDPTTRRIGGGYIASFIGMVPAREPQAVVLVIVDHPKGGMFYGGQVAGPVFVEMASAIIRRKGIPPDTEGGQGGRLPTAAGSLSGTQVQASASQTETEVRGP